MSDSLWPPWTAACQASLSITNSQSLLKVTSIELVMPSNHLIFCHPLLLLPQSFPKSGSFQMSQFFASGGPSIGVAASASVLPMNIQDWSPLGSTGLISFLSKGFSRVFSNTTFKSIKITVLNVLYLLYYMYCTYCTKWQTVTFLYVFHPLFLCHLLSDSGQILQ